eukprot:CAMPEP_0201921626 /NCGR_PEP_ID=MMETSP0903-20130614/9899_1 /ASSEMBLY_ACC=CAM_ASM_000552 /TAXON_ID=420261 /ORGANISM="Thalassiosira antarctica, Strain CCMP982" /LENGTH=901 /DNA_ID=CAMNT_0048458619 /DNA_START=243 /DNA_END=2948 /DNA_ORIENTATION=+
MTCTNPNCRHRTKRKLRPLVISLIPPSDGTSSPKSGSGNSRHEQITRMFTTHPSLSTHFEPPIFSPGVPSRDLRNRLKLLEHANRAGLITGDEWMRIDRAVSEQSLDDDAINIPSDDNQEDNVSSKLPTKSSESPAGEKHKVINPFRYLATTTRIQPSDDDEDTTNKSENKSTKNKDWQQYETTSLIPISPQRQGSAEDISLPYSMELWRKAKGLNRDRSVLACTLAHLVAMKTLVGDSENENDTLDDSGGDGGFDFILEDNVRAFVGIQNMDCECANRIWDTIEASNDAPSECHMRYYGWLGSSPNLTWTYKNHIPRSAFNGAPLQQNDAETSKCAVFPFPTSDDFELDSIVATSKSKKKEGQGKIQSEESLEDESTSNKASQTPHFTTPGGTAVWGTFAYTISSAAYRTLINQLQNDVGALAWKGKRMRCYQAKPIDKILPRIIKSEFGQRSVHLPDRVAFVRGPMLGSLLHPQWEEGFCSSTELQYRLSVCGGDDEDVDSSVGSDVWDRVWLTKEERQIVNHRKSSGKWLTKGDMNIMEKEATSCSSITATRRPLSSATIAKVIPLLAVFVAVISLSLSVVENLCPPLLPRYALVDAFTINTPLHNNKYKHGMMMSSSAPDEVLGERKKVKLGTLPIISRTIPIEIDTDDSTGNGIKRLDVTVWEMEKPSDLIQEWWSIDETERAARSFGDPFGIVMWPGSILASRELMKQHESIANATVLVLGAGTGVEAQTAALLGANKVIATDINPLTLKLLDFGAKSDDRIGDAFEAKYFDLFSDDPLPACDILIAADVLYNPELAKQVGLRLHEAIVRSFEEGTPPTKVIVTDSQQFHGTNFLVDVAKLRELNALFEEDDWEQLKWETQKLSQVCTSGVLIEEDQTYDVKIRMISWGWRPTDY